MRVSDSEMSIVRNNVAACAHYYDIDALTHQCEARAGKCEIMQFSAPMAIILVRVGCLGFVCGLRIGMRDMPTLRMRASETFIIHVNLF